MISIVPCEFCGSFNGMSIEKQRECVDCKNIRPWHPSNDELKKMLYEASLFMSNVVCDCCSEKWYEQRNELLRKIQEIA